MSGLYNNNNNNNNNNFIGHKVFTIRFTICHILDQAHVEHSSSGNKGKLSLLIVMIHKI